MAKVIKCDCGYVARGETKDELLAAAREHIQDAHPDIAGKLADEDLLGMAEEV